MAAKGTMVNVKHALQGLMVQYEEQFANWVQLPFPAELTFGQYTKMMAKNLSTIGMQTDANLHMFIKPGGSSAGFTPTPDQSLGDLYDLFKSSEGYLVIDIAGQPIPPEQTIIYRAGQKMALQFRYLQKLRENELAAGGDSNTSSYSHPGPRQGFQAADQQPTPSPLRPVSAAQTLHQLPLAATTGRFKGRTNGGAVSPNPLQHQQQQHQRTTGGDTFFSVLDAPNDSLSLDTATSPSRSSASASAASFAPSARDLMIQQRGASPDSAYARRGPRERANDAAELRVAVQGPRCGSAKKTTSNRSSATTTPVKSPKRPPFKGGNSSSTLAAAAARKTTPPSRGGTPSKNPRIVKEEDFREVDEKVAPQHPNIDRMNYFVVRRPTEEIANVKTGGALELKRKQEEKMMMKMETQRPSPRVTSSSAASAAASPSGTSPPPPPPPPPPVGGLYVSRTTNCLFQPIAAFIRAAEQDAVSPVRAAAAAANSPRATTTPHQHHHHHQQQQQQQRRRAGGVSPSANRFDRMSYQQHRVAPASSQGFRSPSLSTSVATTTTSRRKSKCSSSFRSLVPRFSGLVAHGSGLVAPVLH